MAAFAKSWQNGISHRGEPQRGPILVSVLSPLRFQELASPRGVPKNPDKSAVVSTTR